MEKPGYVYIMTNPNNTVFYTGVTSSLKTRVYQHREKLVDGFTKEFNCINLVYYEDCGTIYNAIVREKQIKGKTRAKKIQMIKNFNSTWKDLYDTL